jgi:hypothetical protein
MNKFLLLETPLMDPTSGSRESRFSSFQRGAEPPILNLISGKQLLLLQSPPSQHAHLPERASLALIDANGQGENVGFHAMLPSAPSPHEDRILPPPRRAFKKSRKGCRTCKARKVKVSREPSRLQHPMLTCHSVMNDIPCVAIAPDVTRV